MKIYDNDPNVHYKGTEVSALRTKSQIDGILAEWGIKDSGWRWDPDHNDVFIEFKLKEKIKGIPAEIWIKVVAPAIWHKGKNNIESINWKVSLRVMHWFIKSQLEMAYLWQSEKTLAFLPFVKAGDDQTLGNVIISNLERIQDMPALPEIDAEKVIQQ